MNSEDIPCLVHDRLEAQLPEGEKVDAIHIFMSENLRDAVEAGWILRGKLGKTLLVSIAESQVATRNAEGGVVLESYAVVIQIVRFHSELRNATEEHRQALALLDDVRVAINDTDNNPSWWTTAGFVGMLEQGVVNLTDAALEYSAFQITYEFGVCRT